MITLGTTLRSVALIAALGAVGFGASNIGKTKHNLSANWVNTGVSTSNNDDRTIKATAGENNNEICVYCHTPHAANPGFNGAPLWNKATPTGTFLMYAKTIAGTTQASEPASPSMACLSCHDGVSAINSMVNAPGSGGWTAGGANALFNGSTATKTIGTGVTNLGLGDAAANGPDLRNDHPISIPYTAGNASLVATSTTLNGWAGATKVSDLLRGGNIECGSCHDPHEAENGTFLRVANASSALCTGCHAK